LFRPFKLKYDLIADVYDALNGDVEISFSRSTNNEICFKIFQRGFLISLKYFIYCLSLLSFVVIIVLSISGFDLSYIHHTSQLLF
jgi:hypothetical protein